MRKAFITGITGQIGSYLAEYLLDKGYLVGGLVRRSSAPHLERLEHIIHRLQLFPGDVTDYNSIRLAVESFWPDEVYNLAAQSFVGDSWKFPNQTTDVTGTGVLNVLRAVKDTNINIRFFQASTSEMFGLVQETPQTETTPFYPRSPYGVAKLYGHWMTINFRESYNMFACCGILFNTESHKRGQEFVTKKIADGAWEIAQQWDNLSFEPIKLGNLS